MLEKSKQKNCYGDTIVGDVALFVRDYAANVRKNKIYKEEKEIGREGGREGGGREGGGGNGGEIGVGKGTEIGGKIGSGIGVEVGGGIEGEIGGDVGEDEYPLLDFITAVDVFMYLGKKSLFLVTVIIPHYLLNVIVVTVDVSG